MIDPSQPLSPPLPPSPGANVRLAVVLVTDCYATARPVVLCLKRQNVRDQMEIVLVAPPGGFQDVIESDLSEFAIVRRQEVPSVDSLPVARAAGVRAATAPIVFIGETHSYPQPGWAEALLRAHQGPWFAVVSGITNAQKRGALYWAGYIMDYSPWGEELPAGEIDTVLVYNTAYKRSLIPTLGIPLEQFLSPYAEILPKLMAQRGLKVYLATDARLAHLGMGMLRAHLMERFFVGNIIGAKRASRWSFFRRLAYFCGSPLVPLVLFRRVFPSYQRVRRRHRLPWGTLPLVLIGYVAKALGEMSGYVAGCPKWIEAKETVLEINRLRYCPGYAA